MPSTVSEKETTSVQPLFLTIEQCKLYLKRIGLLEEICLANNVESLQDLKQKLKPTLETLKRLQEAHTTHIPFENLNIHMGQAVVIDESHVFEKLVLAPNRGGYCFEQNMLFGHFLTMLGFEVRTLGARVLVGCMRQKFLPLNHRTHLVTIPKGDGDEEENSEDRVWLVDVGFGGTTPMVAPLLFKTNVECKVYSDTFRIEFDETLNYILQWYDASASQWEDMYCFSTLPFMPIDYVMMNYFVSTHPESLFVNNLFCGLATLEGTKVVFNNKFTVRDNHKITERVISNMEEMKDVLMNELKIQVPDHVTNFPRVSFERHPLK